MSQLATASVHTEPIGDSGAGWRQRCRMAGVTAWVQWGCLLITLMVATNLGTEPATAQGYFTMLQSDRLVGLLRLDFTTLLLRLALMPPLSVGIYADLRSSFGGYTFSAGMHSVAPMTGGCQPCRRYHPLP